MTNNRYLYNMQIQENSDESVKALITNNGIFCAEIMKGPDPCFALHYRDGRTSRFAMSQAPEPELLMAAREIKAALSAKGIRIAGSAAKSTRVASVLLEACT